MPPCCAKVKLGKGDRPARDGACSSQVEGDSGEPGVVADVERVAQAQAVNCGVAPLEEEGARIRDGADRDRGAVGPGRGRRRGAGARGRGGRLPDQAVPVAGAAGLPRRAVEPKLRVRDDGYGPQARQPVGEVEQRDRDGNEA